MVETVKSTPRSETGRSARRREQRRQLIIAAAQDYAGQLETEHGLSGFNVRVGIDTGLVKLPDLSGRPQYLVDYSAPLPELS